MCQPFLLVQVEEAVLDLISDVAFSQPGDHLPMAVEYCTS